LHPTLAVIRAVHPIIILIITFPLVGIGHTSSVLALIFFSIKIAIEKFTENKRTHSDLSWASLITVYFPAVAFRFLPKNSVNTVVLGFFGLSGIGDFFENRVLLLEYQDASVALLAIIISIGSLDLLSQAVWRKVNKAKEGIFV
jgi:ABC-type phosphate/phosphonate transport system permease subunit